jgi:hypothetical protein
VPVLFLQALQWQTQTNNGRFKEKRTAPHEHPPSSRFISVPLIRQVRIAETILPMAGHIGSPKNGKSLSKRA